MLEGYLGFKIMLSDTTNVHGTILSMYNPELDFTLCVKNSILVGVNDIDNTDNIIPIYIFVKDEVVLPVVSTPDGMAFVCKTKCNEDDELHIAVVETRRDKYNVIRDETLSYSLVRSIFKMFNKIGK